jgi:hypothetical protein
MDYTASNLQQGIRTFGGRSLHQIVPNNLNPYQRVCKYTKIKSINHANEIINFFKQHSVSGHIR